MIYFNNIPSNYNIVSFINTNNKNLITDIKNIMHNKLNIKDNNIYGKHEIIIKTFFQSVMYKY